MNGNPCTSWTVNTADGEWHAPNFYSAEDRQTYGNFKWNETNQRWRAKKFTEYKNDPEIWYEYNPGDQTWSAL